MRHFSVARLFKSMAMACIALTSAPLMAVDFDQSQYDIYIGDRNGDGRDDILLVAKDSIIPIHGEVLVPLAVQLSENYAIESGPGFYYDPVTLSDAEIDLSGFALASDISIADYNNDGNLDLIVGQQNGLLSEVALLGGGANEIPQLVSSVDGGGFISSPPSPITIAAAELESKVTLSDLNESDSLTPIFGEFQVNASGGAVYDIPIFTPPGSGGVEPQISLSYSSQSGNGLLGLGWSLSGLSTISRCRQTMVTDGVAAPITWSENDRFCLDGQRLLLETGSEYGAVGATYKTELDTYVKVVSVGGTLGHPEHFLVNAKDGSVSQFGNTTDSKFNNLDDQTYMWSLNRFADSVGNKIDYEYLSDIDSQIISKISYGSSELNHSFLEFNYEERPNDKLVTYSAGLKMETNDRLKSIVVKNGSSILRNYSLTYDSVNHDFSRVVKIDECGSDSSNCRAATQLTWQYPIVGLSSSPEELYSLDTTGFIDSASLDINGDGNLDFAYIRATGGGSNHKFSYAISDGEVLTRNPTEISFREDVGRHTVKLEVIDYNADGRSDLLIYNELDSKWTLYLAEYSNGAWALNQKSTILPFSNEETSFGDVNSDGLVDAYYYTKGEGLYIHHLEQSGLSASENTFYHFSSSPDFYALANPRFEILDEVLLYCGISTFRYEDSDSVSFDLKSDAVGDFNSDGRVDFVFSLRERLRGSFSNPEPPNIQVDLPDNFSCQTPVVSLKNYLVYTLDKENNELKFDRKIFNSHVYSSGDLDDSDSDTAMSLDVNGDGVSDIVTYTRYADSETPLIAGIDQFPYHWQVMLSDGEDYLPPIEILRANESSIDQKAQFVDYNNDSYLDFVFHDFENSRLEVKYWNPESQSFDVIASAIPVYDYDLTGFNYQVSNASGPYTSEAASTVEYFEASSDDRDSYYFTNLDGSGGDDLIWLDASEQILYVFKNKNTGVTNHAISSIVDGLGAKTNVVYEPISQSESYIGHSVNDSIDEFYKNLNDPFDGLHNVRFSTTLAPVLPLDRGLNVVTQVKTSAPTTSNPNALATTSYFYHQAKIQAGGRGFLGFSKLESLNQQNNILSSVDFRQDYPYLGVPRVSEQSYNGNVISRVTNEWASMVANQPDGVRYQPYILNSIEENFSVASNQSQFIVGSSLLSRVETINQYDNFGNPTSISVETVGGGESYKVSTSNFYGTSEESQFLGRLYSSTVTHERNNDPSSQIVRASNYSYYGFNCGGPDYLYGLLCRETVNTGSGQYERYTEYEYDQFGNKTRALSNGVLVSQRSVRNTYDALGRYSESVINSFNQQTESVISWNKYGNPTEIKDISSASAHYRYTPLGDEYLQYSVTGAYEVYYRDTPNGDCPIHSAYEVRNRTPDGGESFECFDKLNQTTLSASKLINGDWSFVSYHYDVQGRLIRRSEPYKTLETIYFTEYSYDPLGNVLSITEPKLGDEDRVTANEYNGFSITTVNPLGQTRTETRNAFGELERVTDNLGGVVENSYNAIGELSRVTTRSGNTSNTIRTVYDNYSNKIQIDDPDKGIWNYSYNAYGELINQTNAEGETITFSYDALGRLVQREDQSGSKSKWVYDNLAGANSRGQLIQELLIEGGIPYQKYYFYDLFGRLSSQDTFIDGEKHTEEIRYDQYGRDYQTFDAADVRNVIEYDYKNGYIHKITDAIDNENIYYRADKMDARGNVTNYRQDSLTVTRSYDASSGFLKTIKTSVAGITNTQDLTYTWDVLSNLKTRVEASGEKNLTESFGYDALNRLSWSKISNQTQQNFSYDAFGNITFKTGVGNYKYGNQCQIGAGAHAVCEIDNGSTSETFDYDNNGNLTTHRVNGVVERTFEYSDFDKPTRITKGGHVTTFSYDSNRSRYKRTDTDSSGNTTTTIYVGSVEKITKPDGTREIRRYINSSVLITQEYNLDSNGEYQIARAITRHILTDHLGSTDVITNSDGVIVQHQSFDAWGARRDYTDGIQLDDISLAAWADVNNGFTTQSFTGHEAVDEVGVIHMNGRIYDARLGRFLQADPFVQDSTDTQVYNRYSYVRNNPLNATDPSGYIFSQVFNFFKALAAFIQGGGIYNPNINDWVNLINSIVDLVRAIQMLNRTSSAALTNGGFSNNSNDPIGEDDPPGLDQGLLEGWQYYFDYDQELETTVKTVSQTDSVQTGGKFTNGADTQTFVSIHSPKEEADSPDEQSEVNVGVLLVDVALEVIPGGGLYKCSRDSCEPLDWVVATVDLVPGIGKLGKLFKARRLFGSRRTVAETGSQSPRSASNTCCFVAGTQVLTETGYKNIEDVKLGEKLWAKNVETGEQDWKSVTNVFIEPNRGIYEIKLIGSDGFEQKIQATDDHPFYVVGGSWKTTIELVVGDYIETDGDSAMMVVSVIDENRQDITYNFTVADFHTYYVTERKVLVHNCNVRKGGLPDVKKVVNSNLPHARDRAVERGVFPDAKSATAGLKDLSKQIKKNGFPEGTLLDTARADRVLVPVGNNGLAVFQVGSNGTAKLKTTIIAN